MAKKGGGRLISSAGLVTYYDSEDRRAVQVSPVAVLVAAIVIGLITGILNFMF